MRCTHRLLIALMLFVVGMPATVSDAANQYKLAVHGGQTIIELAGYQIAVEATGEVIVAIRVQDGQITGHVALPRNETEPVFVRITVLPDAVIFEGMVGNNEHFESVILHEAGQSEL